MLAGGPPVPNNVISIKPAYISLLANSNKTAKTDLVIPEYIITIDRYYSK
jgi:hypothetical protein